MSLAQGDCTTELVALAGVFGCEFGLLHPRFPTTFKDVDSAGESESAVCVLGRSDNGDVFANDDSLTETVSLPLNLGEQALAC